ncbi:MAG: hypothetical protein P8175_17440 [Deltaproteobacteria bacterium]
MSKKRRKKSTKRASRNRLKVPVREWVGGRLISPFYIAEDVPYRPEIILWLELPENFVVFSRALDPAEPHYSLGKSLLEAMNAPMIGPARKPARIRVCDAQLAAELGDAAGSIEVVVGPTPELDKLLRFLAESMPGQKKPSYFEDGRVSPEAVGKLFRSAGMLYKIAPWKAVSDTEVFRLDIPDFEVKGACLSIIGSLGESLGFVIFPSLEGFERFVSIGEKGLPPEGPVDLGTSTLSLNFEKGADVPASMRREVAENGWPVADAKAYPWVQLRDRDGVPRPITERDVRIAAACALSLTSFFIKHGSLFEREVFPPVCESYFDENDLEVRFTMPYQAGDLFELNDPGKKS